MSSIYHLEPPTKGKVLIHTNYGDIDVELWAKETPLACRNFVQLALEGYYDDTLFHRIIRGFMVQGGDPTGTGSGGESIYGGEFRDEIHQRLRFTHRGIVAMANPNKPNSNTTQFFITLDACEHLKGKHTIFGKVTGDTIYNVVRIGDLATDMDDRPLDPVKITGMEVLWNPFDDVVPRDISESLKCRRATKEGEETEEQRREAKKQARLERAAKKDKKLLSFGDEEDDDEGGSARVVTGKLRSSHDVVKDDPTLRPDVDESVLEAARTERKQAAADAAIKIKQQVASIAGGKIGGDEEDVDEDDRQDGEGVVLKGVDEEAEAFAARMRLQVQRKRKLGQAPLAQKGGSRWKESVKSDEPGPDFSSYEKDLEAAKKAEQERKIREKAEEYQRMKAEMTTQKRAVAVETGEKARQKHAEKAFREMLSPLEARRQKYLEKRRGGTDREADTLTRLSKFRGTLLSKKSDDLNNGKAEDEEVKEQKKKKETESYHGQILEKDILDDDDDDDDTAWFAGKGLKFKKHIDDAYRGGDGRRVDDYVVIHTKSGEARKQQERRER